MGKTETILRATPADDTARWPLLLDLLATPEFTLPDPTAFLARFLQHLSESISVDVGLVYGRDVVQQRWRLLAQIGLPGVVVADAEGLRPWEVLADLASKQEGLVLFSDDVIHDPRCVDPVFQSAPFRAVAGIVLQFDRKPLGALLFGGASPGALTANNRSFFLSAANLLIAPLLRRESGRNRRRWPSDTYPAAFPTVLNEPVSRPRPATDRLVEWLRDFVVRPDPINLSAACNDFLKQLVSRMGADGGVISQWDDLAQRGTSIATIEPPAPINPPALGDVTALPVDPAAPMSTVTADPLSAVAENGAARVPFSLQVPIPGEDGVVWGHLTLQRQRTAFPSETRDIAGLAAKVLGKTITGITRAEQVLRQTQAAAGVDQMARILVKHRAPEPMITAAAEHLVQAFKLTSCAFFCFDERRTLLQGLAASGTQGDAVRKITVPVQADHLVALTARNKEPMVVENARADDRIDKRWANIFRSRAILFLPLLPQNQKNQAIGVVALDDNRTFRQWTPEQIDQVTRLMEPIAMALDNAIYHHAAMREREAVRSHARLIADAHEMEQRKMARRIQEALEKGVRPMKTLLAQQRPQSPPVQPPVPPPQLKAEAPITPVLGELGEHETPRSSVSPVSDATATDSSEQAIAPLPMHPPAQSPTTRPLDWSGLRRQVDQMESMFQGIASALHSPQLERAGFVSALSAESEAFSKRSGVVVHFKPTATTPQRLPPPIEALLHRIVQETFNNVARHAEARAVVVSLEKKGPNIHLTITDDGKGFDAKSRPAAGAGPGVGLVWMRERVELAGGRFSVDSATGRGARVSAVLPVSSGRTPAGPSQAPSQAPSHPKRQEKARAARVVPPNTRRMNPSQPPI